MLRLPKLNFRTDINGLRALAVVAVVFFHFLPASVPGGFAGVDIFFVISGFLMTGIIFKGLREEKFSIFKFYVARANRIIPPLAVLCLVMLIFGWFFLYPADYQAMAKHVGGSLVFLSNIIYWHESGYFDAASREKWLLHTWSLSVEWQFYIIYPIILSLLYRWVSLKTIKRLLIAATICGFIVCIITTIKWPTSAYYFLTSRAWEMMVGGLAYLYPLSIKETHKKYLEYFGIALILASYFLINSLIPWPGYYALIPVMGAYLIIAANCQRSKITDNLACRYLGKWSYSIYLWHWPLVVLGYYFFLPHWPYIGVPISILLGWLSYTFIESIRFKSFESWKNILRVKPIYPAIVVSCLSGIIFVSHGKNLLNTFMSQDEKATLASLQENIVMPFRGNGYCFYDFNSDTALKHDDSAAVNCLMGDQSKKPETLLFGSSFAGMYDPLLDRLFKQNGISYNSVSTNWCSPVFTTSFTGLKTHIAYQQCLSDRKFLKQAIENKVYKNIIIADQWSAVKKAGFGSEVEDVLKAAKENGINVIILPEPKQYIKNPIPLFYREFLEKDHIDLSQDSVVDGSDIVLDKQIKDIASKYNNVTLIPRSSLFDSSGLFYIEDRAMAVPYTLDGEHVSKLGAQHALNHFIDSNYYKNTFIKLIQTHFQ